MIYCEWLLIYSMVEFCISDIEPYGSNTSDGMNGREDGMDESIDRGEQRHGEKGWKTDNQVRTYEVGKKDEVN
jgi:hypothetical protein